MSNVYTNQVLFGHSKNLVDKKYVDGLLPNMLTTQWLLTHSKPAENKEFENPFAVANASSKTEDYSDNRSRVRAEPLCDGDYPQINRNAMKVYESSTACAVTVDIPQPKPVVRPARKTLPGNTLFWAIFSAENPKETFLRPSAANVEIETRIQVVNSLKNTPKRLKDTNSKLSIEATQGLLGSMLIAREDKIEFCIVYSVFYKKHILIVYPNTCRIFSPSTTTDIEDDDHVIILYAEKPDGKIVYSAELNPTKQMADTILQTKPTLLKAQSNYKTPELESIAIHFGIATKTAEGKRRKKEDVYNDVRLVIHNDMNFC